MNTVTILSDLEAHPERIGTIRREIRKLNFKIKTAKSHIDSGTATSDVLNKYKQYTIRHDALVWCLDVLGGKK